MGLNTLFLYLNNNSGLYSASEEINSTYVQAFLNKNKIQSMSFVDNNISNICDFVDDIAAENPVNIAFYVDYLNLRVSSIISKEIKSNYDDIRIIWFGNAVNDCEDIIKDLDVDICVLGEYEKTFLKLASDSPLVEIDNIVFKNEDSFIVRTENKGGGANLIRDYVSPYESKKVLIKGCPEIGIKLMQGCLEVGTNEFYYTLEDVLKELEIVSTIINIDQHKVIKFISEDFFSYYKYNELLDKLKEKSYTFSYKIMANIHSLSKSALQSIYNIGMRDIEINCPSNFKLDEIVCFISEIKEIFCDTKEINLDFNFIVNMHTNIKDVITATNYIIDSGFVSIDKIKIMDTIKKEYLPIIENRSYIISEEKQYSNKVSFYKEAMKNGLKARITGSYPPQIINNGTKHINIGKNILRKEDYQNLKLYTSVNSAILSFSNKEQITENYFDNIDIAKKENYFLSHFHQFYNDGNKELVTFDNCSYSVKINKFNYSKVEGASLELGTNNEDDITYLTISNKEDLKKFAEDLDYFKDNGKLKLQNVRYIIEDECRWGINGSCSLKSLVRFNLDEKMNIRPCNSCGKTIGNIKENYIDNIRQVYKESDKVQVIRECTDCEVKENCSKCVMLPEFLDETEYCTFKKKYIILKDFYLKKSILKYLIECTKIFSTAEIDDIKFSTKHKTHLFTNDMDVKGENRVEGLIHLIFIKDMPLLFETFRNNIIRISEQMAFVIEGGLKEAPKSKIIEEYSKTFKLDKDVAAQAVKEILDLLSSKGYMKVEK